MALYAINADHVTWEVADGEVVVLHFESSAYFALNRSGTCLWTRLAQGPTDPRDLAAGIAAVSGRPVGEVAADVAAFLENLKSEDLVLEREAAPGVPAAPAGPCEAGAYEPPQVTKFGELAQLILSGE
jgi:hypothetical protein